MIEAASRIVEGHPVHKRSTWGVHTTLRNRFHLHLHTSQVLARNSSDRLSQRLFIPSSAPSSSSLDHQLYSTHEHPPWSTTTLNTLQHYPQTSSTPLLLQSNNPKATTNKKFHRPSSISSSLPSGVSTSNSEAQQRLRRSQSAHPVLSSYC